MVRSHVNFNGIIMCGTLPFKYWNHANDRSAQCALYIGTENSETAVCVYHRKDHTPRHDSSCANFDLCLSFIQHQGVGQSLVMSPSSSSTMAKMTRVWIWMVYTDVTGGRWKISMWVGCPVSSLTLSVLSVCVYVHGECMHVCIHVCTYMRVHVWYYYMYCERMCVVQCDWCRV